VNTNTASHFVRKRGRGRNWCYHLSVVMHTIHAEHSRRYIAYSVTHMSDVQQHSPRSLVMHGAARHYDRLVWLLTVGRERALRARLADIAAFCPGEAVLDAGCGTGTLALEAKRRVGAGGRVHGIDASPEMIGRARQKAAAQGIDVTFEAGRAEALPFPDASFDVVLSTLMLHHLPRAVRERFAQEIRRVLRPGGRVLAVDFEPGVKKGGLISRIHRHGHVPLREIIELLRDAGLNVVDMGGIGFGDLQFAVAKSNAPDPSAAPPEYRLFDPLPRPRWIIPSIIVVVVAAHILLAYTATSRLAVPALSILALVALVIAMHATPAGVLHRIVRHRRRD
jgi:ubiquinone/menaquinone biosynthesis C-methylase UbiE